MVSSDRVYVPTKITRETLRVLLSTSGGLPLKVYLVLCDLDAHLDGGWLGSVQALTAEYASRAGHPSGQTEIGAAVAKLEAAGLLTIDGMKNLRRTFRLGSRETRDRSVTGNPWAGSRETRELGHGKPVSVSRETRDPLYESGERIEREDREGRSRGIGAGISPGGDHGIAAPRLPVRGGKIVVGAADGLADAIRAAGLRRSDRQVELLVADCGSDEIRRQLAWLPRRDASWCKDKPGALERWFEKMCREQECEPASGDSGVKPLLSPDAVSALKAELRDRRATKGAVARALEAVGVADLEHLTGDGRRAFLAALEGT